MFRCERWDSLIRILLGWSRQRISDWKNSRVEHADDIPAVCFLYHLTFAGHHLLGLWEPYFLTALDMIDVHSRFKFSGTDPHERDPIPVRLVHIRLDLEYKRRKILLFHRIYTSLIRRPRKRRRSHIQKMLKKSLHPEIREGRTEEYRGQLPFAYQLLIERRSCSVL